MWDQKLNILDKNKMISSIELNTQKYNIYLIDVHWHRSQKP